MNRDKAREVQDRLVSQGYTVNVMGSRLHGHVIPGADPPDEQWTVSVRALHFDKIDLRHLCSVADGFDLDVVTGQLSQGELSIVEQDPRPDVVRTPRHHPRQPRE